MLTVTQPKVRSTPRASLARPDRLTLRNADGTGYRTLARKYQAKHATSTHLAVNKQSCVMGYRYMLDDRQSQTSPTRFLTATFIDAIKALG